MGNDYLENIISMTASQYFSLAKFLFQVYYITTLAEYFVLAFVLFYSILLFLTSSLEVRLIADVSPPQIYLIKSKENLRMHKKSPVTHKLQPRKLEDLNLIDNFLFQEMISQKGIGEEFAKILLGTILGKTIRNVRIVPQKNILGVDTNRHGVRLDAYIEDISDQLIPSASLLDAEIRPDIYDIEPNNSYERKSLPKRMRYYHGLIDTQVLSSGTDYESLQNVVIIIILPYDPFGKNRMVYTIQNQCLEDASVTYDDGAKKIFLYTHGIEGNPSQELKDMLRYIEKTTVDNITNQRIEAINNLVNKVKHNKEVGINYMKSWEYEKMIREQAIREGHEEGLKQGIEQGIEQGIKQGIEDGIMVFLELCKELDIPQDEALLKTMDKFHLSPECAASYLQKYW